MDKNTTLNSNKKIKAKENCHLCQGTGISTYADLEKMPEGSFTFEYLLENFGGKAICPECFPFPLNISKNIQTYDSKDINKNLISNPSNILN